MKLERRGWAVLLLAVCVPAFGAAAEGPLPVELPVSEVTVFSDRARVVRSAQVKLPPGTAVVRLPALPAAIDPDSVRLEAEGASVVRVEVRRFERDELPAGEARALIDEIERLSGEVKAAVEAIGIVEAERTLLQSIHPSSPVFGDPKGAPRLLDPSGWQASLEFLDARAASQSATLGLLERRLADTRRRLVRAVELARVLAAGTAAKPGYDVQAVVESKGKGTLRLAYMARGARWYPAYDVRFEPGTAHVDLALAALVSQETGEDWISAPLVLSTAVPATTAALPRLAVWKIGEKERFIPTPVALAEPGLPRPKPLPRGAAKGGADDGLRERLWAAVGAGDEAAQMERPAVGSIAGAGGGLGAGTVSGYGRSAAMAGEGRMGGGDARAKASDAYAPQATMSRSRSRLMEFSSAPEAHMAQDDADRISFGAPGGWRAPSYPQDLPAALAGGYDFTYRSARAESVRSGAEARRVPLHSVRLPAEALVRVYPALSSDAFLTAAATNTSGGPLLKGRASLFVGRDLVGDAVVPTVAAGERTDFALGIDDAVRVERNVKVLSSEQGFLSKRDVSEYEVVIELLNPRAKAVTAVVFDQLPLAKGENVEVKLLSSSPAPAVDAPEGFLEWRLELPPGQKKAVSFRYSFARPKDARPWQAAAPKGGQ